MNQTRKGFTDNCVKSRKNDNSIITLYEDSAGAQLEIFI